VITGLYIPILSGAVLIFTGLRIRATLRRRRNVQIRHHQRNTSQLSITNNNNTTRTDQQRRQQPAAVNQLTPRSARITRGGRRTLKILTFTSLAYFTFWSPYVFTTVKEIRSRFALNIPE